MNDEHPLVQALRPLAEAVGAEMVEPGHPDPDVIPVEWEGRVVCGFKLKTLHGALERMVAQVEREMGGELTTLSRVDKQVAVRVLDERGAFRLRRSIEDVADQLGVSRITVYNYLNSIRAGASR